MTKFRAGCYHLAYFTKSGGRLSPDILGEEPGKETAARRALRDDESPQGRWGTPYLNVKRAPTEKVRASSSVPRLNCCELPVLPYL